ncbi:hypothetical protein GTO27_13210 [Candidatus Bathyarchaeota archaeon]|nr:hypothetical protein [Candidatus Bathyarchaeota archaeon]
MRNARKETRILIYPHHIRAYKEFWNDSILVIVVPCGDIFYAQKISELEASGAYDATLEFEKFENIFTRVRKEELSHFKNKALEIMKAIGYSV